MKVLIIGGTGVISRAVLRQLVDTGHHVTIVNRGKTETDIPAGTERLIQDRTDREGFARLFALRRFDVVLDMISFTAEDARQTVELFGKTGAHIVIVSSVAAYKRPYRTIPTREDREELWDDPAYPYGYKKALMERYLQGEMNHGTPITVVRPSLTFGEGSRNVGILRQNVGILQRIRQGKALIMFGDGTTPWSFTFAPDLARGIISLFTNSKAMGQSLHIASEEPTEWSELYRAFGRVVGQKPILKYLPASWLLEIDRNRFGHIFHEKCHPGLFSGEKMRSIVPGFRITTTLDEGLQSVISSWQRDGLQVDPELDKLEDQLVTYCPRPCG